MRYTRRPSDEPEPGTVDPDAFANAWVGVPFKWDGRDPRGVDCWGLVWRFYRDCLGETLPDWTKGDNGQAWIDATFAAELAEHWQPLPEPRDFALAICPAGRRPAHVGIWWRGGVLHSKAGRGVVWEAGGVFCQAYPGTQAGLYCEGAK